MDIGCTLDLGSIIDLSCGLLHQHRACLSGSWASCVITQQP